MRFLLIILSSFLLFSCATPFKKVMWQYQEAPICCGSYEEFEYEKLALPDSRNFKIDQDSQAFVFDTGKSYFKAFELPEYSSPYKISITSYMIGETIKAGYIFYPAVMLLNAEYDVTRMIRTGLFRFAKAGLPETWGPGRKLEGTVHIDQDNSDEKYMIIMTTDELLGAIEEDEVPVMIPVIFPGFVGVIPTWKKEKVFVPHSPVGKFAIKIFENGD